MTTITEITKATSVAPVTKTVIGRSTIASCVLGAGSSPFSATVLFTTGLLGGTDAFGAGGGRPAQAPAAGAAQAFGYASAANGAEIRRPGANGDVAVMTEQHRKTWAFRGLEPWRDPA